LQLFQPLVTGYRGYKVSGGVKLRAVKLRALTGETFWFDPGAFCLEFALTGGAGYRAAYETLHEPGDLARWCWDSVAVDVSRVTSRDLVDAKRLRAAIWQLADGQVEGRPLPRRAVEEINAAAAKPSLAPQIGPATARRWTTPARPSQLLSTVARDAIDLFTGPMAGRIRRCAGVNCTLVFADMSRPGRRRWCSMERCGNRAKVHAFRNRHNFEEEAEEVRS
jgi:predicted RNA-binding Zn ribbon-like protein